MKKVKEQKEEKEPERTIVITRTLINPVWLSFRREKSGLSLREVARRLKISASYLSDIELGNGRYANEKIVNFYIKLK